jgi:uncharacterized protein YutE (UPF0331/DUF86 family)
MIPSPIRANVVVKHIHWVNQMLFALRLLPLQSYEIFRSDPRNAAAAESYLRRALEALFDLARHLLSKGFGQAVAEYKEVGSYMVRMGVLDSQKANSLRDMAGYRNRLVHFYRILSDQDLYDICTHRLTDIELLLSSLLDWIRAHPEKIDKEI